MDGNNEQLSKFLELLKTDLINSMQARGAISTGQTAKQLVVVTDGSSVQLQIPGYMQLLETGRGPTSNDATPGSPPMIQRIQQWCRAKGIPDKAAWAIKKSIDKKGFKGKPGILSQPLGDQNINMRLNAVMEDIVKVLTDELTKNIMPEAV